MKKIACLMIMAMMLTLSACGQSSTTGNVESNPAPEVNPTGSVEAIPEETETPDAEDAEIEETEIEEEAISLGSIQGGVYTNEFLDLKLTLDEDWVLADEDELAEMVGLTAEALSDENIADLISNSGIIYDLFASADDGLVTLNIVIEDAGVLGGLAYSEDDYVKAGLEYTASAYEDLEITDVTTTIQTTTFAGKEHSSLYMEGTYMGEYPIYQSQVVIKSGHYFATVTATSYLDNVTIQLLDMFESLN